MSPSVRLLTFRSAHRGGQPINPLSHKSSLDEKDGRKHSLQKKGWKPARSNKGIGTRTSEVGDELKPGPTLDTNVLLVPMFGGTLTISISVLNASNPRSNRGDLRSGVYALIGFQGGRGGG